MDISQIKPGDSIEWYQQMIGGELVEPTFTGTLVKDPVFLHKGEQWANLYSKCDHALLVVERDQPWPGQHVITDRQVKSYGQRSSGWLPSPSAFAH